MPPRSPLPPLYCVRACWRSSDRFWIRATRQSLPVDARLSELGMSSIKMVNLMLAVEGEFDLTIPQQDITPDNFRSVTSIEALLERLLELKG